MSLHSRYVRIAVYDNIFETSQVISICPISTSHLNIPSMMHKTLHIPYHIVVLHRTLDDRYLGVVNWYSSSASNHVYQVSLPKII